MVCTESTTSSAGLDRVEVAEHRAQVGLGGQVEPVVQRADPLGPQPDLAADSSPVTHERRLPAPAAHCWATSSSRVDLPTPGSPASSTTAPGTRPPPSTRSSSPTPVGRALAASTPIVGDRPRRRGDRAGGDGGGQRAQPTGAAPTSATEPHAWHSGQRPTQRGGVCPHSAHR